MACFSTQVLLGGMLHLESKHYSLSKRKLSQRREKERLLFQKRKFSSWVKLGRSEEPDLKVKLEGAQMQPQLCQYMPGIHHQSDGNSAKCLGCLLFPVTMGETQNKCTFIHARTAQRYFTGPVSLPLHTTAVLDLP